MNGASQNTETDSKALQSQEELLSATGLLKTVISLFESVLLYTAVITVSQLLSLKLKKITLLSSLIHYF